MADNMGPKDKTVQVKIEIGHQSVCRENKTTAGHTHDWSIFVRGAEGADISHFVEKVAFLLHKSYRKPRRLCKRPPYKISETGYCSFKPPVDIYFRNNEEPLKYRLEYDLKLQQVGMPPYNFTKVELLTFLNPSEDFERKLLKGGATILIPPSSSPGNVPEPEVTENTPASPHGFPNGTKEDHSSKTKVKDDTQQGNALKQSSKCVNLSEEDVSKPKKKKLDENDSSSNSCV